MTAINTRQQGGAMAMELRAQPSWLTSLGRLARQKPLGTVSAVLVAILVIAAATAPLISPFDPLAMHSGMKIKPPSAQFLLGTDELSRDVLSRIIWGARISLWVGMVAVCFGTLTGAFIGLVSGYWGGKLDMVIQRIMDMIMCFPGLVLALSVMAILGQDLNNVMVAIAIVIIPGNARVVRGAVLSVKEFQFVEAAESIGATKFGILLRHILPNVVAPIIVLASVMLGNAIIIEASLSFLGLGTPPPTPSWGGMLSKSGRVYMESAPWLAVFPGLAISLAVLGFNMLGDALRDVLDPRLRGSR